MLLRDLLHMRGQVIAVALVVACGVATYVTMRSSYEALISSKDEYYEKYRFADVFSQLKRAPQSLESKLAAIPGVVTAQTRVVVEVTLDVAGVDEPATGRLVSIPQYRVPMLNDIFLRAGRWVEPGRREEVLVSESFSEANGLKVGDSVGAVINGRWEKLLIVGIALSPEYVNEIRGADVFPDHRRFGIFWMAREALGPAFDMEGGFNDVSIALAPGASEAEVIARTDSLLEPYGGLGAYGRSEQLSHRFLSDEISQDRITGIFVPFIFLGIAAFLVHTVLSRLVASQRNQIAVLRAFGYSSAAVGLHYLKFGLAAALTGAVGGTALGIWLGSGLANLYMEFFHFPVLIFRTGPELIGLAVVISAGSAVVGALSAVRKVMSLPPAEAMRPEPPARFRSGLLERLGLRRLLSPAGRMIVRNIERRPIKAMLSVLGIALAVAILVVGRYFFDALDYIIEVQFRTVQREDVAVSFNNPKTSRVKYDLTHLHGVLRMEPFRVVPARLRFEHRSRRVGILGLSPEGQLRRLMDREMNVLALPTEGVVVTAKLAELLGVRVGDLITVEVLEGARPIKQVLVAGSVDEMIGISAYADIRMLNRLMREGPTISGAYLAIDQAASGELYSVLKRTPAVSGVAIREAMLESFLDTIAESLTISTTVLIGFACVIAFGMVYNGSRISLSERGNELASLRVLGFSRREVAVMLFGEQVILTLIAVPFGFAIGYGICAGLALAMESELYRMPVIISLESYAFAFVVVAIAALLSALLVGRRLNRLDLIAVLKARE
jgi:putative ABC transport system permease protein